jgi:hypothetical protein
MRVESGIHAARRLNPNYRTGRRVDRFFRVKAGGDSWFFVTADRPHLSIAEAKRKQLGAAEK